MAAVRRNTINLLKKWNYLTKHIRSYSDHKFKSIVPKCVYIAGSGLALYYFNKYGKYNTVYALKSKTDDVVVKSVKLTARERRFIKFASVEYDGQLYMTPQDFLESVVEQEPRPRLQRRELSTKELEELRDATPQLRKGSSQLFRSLRDKGVISYTEYLFLLSILTKPASGFRIAFNMFDTDGNQRIDKNEFLVIQRLLGGSLKDRKHLDPMSQNAVSLCDICFKIIGETAYKRIIYNILTPF